MVTMVVMVVVMVVVCGAGVESKNHLTSSSRETGKMIRQ